MSLTSYPCSIPQYVFLILSFQNLFHKDNNNFLIYQIYFHKFFTQRTIIISDCLTKIRRFFHSTKFICNIFFSTRTESFTPCIGYSPGCSRSALTILILRLYGLSTKGATPLFERNIIICKYTEVL